MKLLLDIGNSRVKWASCDAGRLFDHGGVAYTPGSLADRIGGVWSPVARPERVVACNVGGEAVARTLAAWFRRTWGLETEFVSGAAGAFGITSAYADPAQLGIDRWMALIAARRQFNGAVCIVDCGTAITLDVLEAGGRHLGGLILPGLSLMRRSLLDHTEGIAEATGREPSPLAITTGDAVASGTLLAAVSLVDRVVSDMERGRGTGLQCVITGGDLESLAPHLGRPWTVVPDLVLRGVAAVAEAAR